MESTKKGGKVFSFIWSEDSMKVLIEICLQFQLENGREKPFKWQEILIEFERVVGKKCNEVSLWHKYYAMKKDWMLWKFLKRGEPGLACDPTTGKITAEPAWWETKIREEPLCKKFRDTGIPPEIEKMWDHLFGGTMARVSGTGRVDASDEFGDTEYNQALDEDSLGTDEDTLDDGMLLMCVAATAAVQNLMFMGLMDAQRRSPIIRAYSHTMADGMRVVERMVGNGVLVDESPLWCCALSKLKDAKSREMFLKLRDDEHRRAWLDWELFNQK